MRNKGLMLPRWQGADMAGTVSDHRGAAGPYLHCQRLHSPAERRQPGSDSAAGGQLKIRG